MFKKIGLSSIALAAMLMLAAPPRASAKVRFGVSVGRPVYSYPVDPYAYNYPYNYQYDPYGYQGYNYAYPNTPYVTPYYSAPYYSFGFGWGGNQYGHERHEYRERQEHRGGREFRGGHEHFRERR
jgi:hypothetical protein